MIYVCEHPWTTPKRDTRGRKTEEMRDIPRFSWWKCDPEADRLNGEILLRRVNSITRKYPLEEDFATIPKQLFFHCLKPQGAKRNLYECIKKLSIPETDEFGNQTGETVIYKGRIWELDTTGATILSADIHLDDLHHTQWAELSADTFIEHFRPLMETESEE